MAAYRLYIKSSAAKELDGVARKTDRQKIVERIRLLATDPRPRGAEKLAGHDHVYRLRQGTYRILYRIDDPRREVTVYRIGHRRQVYR